MDGGIPRYPYGLGVSQSRSQSVPVNRSDLLNSQSETKKYEGRLEMPGFTPRELNELIFVNIGGIVCHVDLELGEVTLVRQDPARLGSEGASGSERWYILNAPGSCRRTKPFAGILSTRVGASLDKSMYREWSLRVVGK